MPNKMERFTQRARRVLSFAQEEAERRQHSYIGTEHMLLGLMREEDGVAARVLADLGLTLDRTGQLVDQVSKAGQRPPEARLELAPEVKKVLELAVDEARRMGHHYIGTEHLLIGLVRREGAAVDILARLNVRPEEVRRRTRHVLQERPPAITASTAELKIARNLLPTPNLAVDVIAMALSQARHYGHGYVDIWHVVRALQANDGIGGRVIRALGISQTQVEELLANEPILAQVSAEGRILPRVQNALEAAIEEARTRKHKYVLTEDLLLGLLRQNPGMFERFNVTPDAVRAKLEEILKEPPPSSAQTNDPEKPAQ
jgi:ATP-dependent Clp protease ATP-binding subunit ClpC